MPIKIPESILGLEREDEGPYETGRDIIAEATVSDSVFQVYKNQFAYDGTDLEVEMESRDEGAVGWIHETVSFAAAYGDERIIAHLFLPKISRPPFQTVIYFPGSAALQQPSSQDLADYYEFVSFLSFIVKNGRAALFPVYKGTFERSDPRLIPIHGGADSHQYTEYLTQLVKDFKRCIDYLESRPDIDSQKLAYYGMSWGGLMGAIIPAVEERLSASLILAGGLTGKGLPEANQLSYVGRIEIPTLMLNGRYDTIFIYETSVKPMFDLMGTPDKDKELKLYDTDHIPPMNEFIKEILAWLDRYLGPVSMD